MIGPEILAHQRALLTQSISERATAPPCDPLPVTPWIAMSLLQKAVRRGRTDLALQAAATLLMDSPERLWRRCGGIAFEDIGIADFDVVGLVTIALSGKRLRAMLGGEWAVASFIVEAMAKARKCRSADDLLMSVELLPTLAGERQRQATLSIQQLRRIVLSPAPLHERALALWYILGTDRRPSRHLAVRKGEPAFVFDLLDELGTPMTLTETAREGFRRTREVLCPFVGLVALEPKATDPTTQNDDVPPEMPIGPAPGWALDIYTREGRAAIGRFATSNAETASWIRDRLTPSRRIDVLGGLLFQVEGGLMAHRLEWPLGDELRHLNKFACRGMPPDEAREGLELMRRDIPILNDARTTVMGSARHDR